MTSNLLTTLANAKAWANISTTNDDALFTRLIGSASRFILSYIERPTLFQGAYTDVFDGKNTRSQMLRQFPVLSVSSVTVGMQSIAALASLSTYGCGYLLDPWDGFPPGRPQAVTLRGYEFCRGYSNVQITYTAGFVTQNEAQTIPGSGYQVTPNAPNGIFAIDQGVTYANGTALTPIASGTPAQGQYVPPRPWAASPTSVYQFAAADANQGVLISYSYIPADIEQACVELVGERYNYRGHVGQVSKSLGGQETVSYSQKDIPDYLRTALQPYKSYIPV